MTKIHLYDKLPILFWGTPDFTLSIPQTLLDQGYNIVGIITVPDETPAKIFANNHKIPVFQPENLKTLSESDLPQADLYIVAGYGKIIPKHILEVPKLGALVIHPSLLPRWRGPSPVQFSILNGDKETGTTIIKMDELADHGPIVAQKIVCEVDKKTFSELNHLLWEASADLLKEILPGYIAGEIKPVPQNDSLATFSKIFKKDDGRIDWKKKSIEVEHQIRALNPWPGTWTLLPTKDKILRVKIEAGESVEMEYPQGSPGFIWQDGESVLIKTDSGSLRLKTITLEGKKPLDAVSFAHGYSHLMGTTFI